MQDTRAQQEAEIAFYKKEVPRVALITRQRIATKRRQFASLSWSNPAEFIRGMLRMEELEQQINAALRSSPQPRLGI